MAFSCKGCPYAQTPSNNLKFENNRSNYLLVFQAPGNDEWTGGSRTMSGGRVPIDSVDSHSCAKRMRNSFSRKRLNRTDFDIAEAVCCFPGKQSNGRDKKPRVLSIKMCTDNMVNLLTKKTYSQITCFGDIAYKVVVDAIGKIPSWRGPVPRRSNHPSSGISNLILDSSY